MASSACAGSATRQSPLPSSPASRPCATYRISRKLLLVLGFCTPVRYCRGAAAGLDPCRYVGHSLRAGVATSAAAGAASDRSIMAQTGHRSTDMVRRCIREANLFTADNAASLAGCNPDTRRELDAVDAPTGTCRVPIHSRRWSCRRHLAPGARRFRLREPRDPDRRRQPSTHTARASLRLGAPREPIEPSQCQLPGGVSLISSERSYAVERSPPMYTRIQPTTSTELFRGDIGVMPLGTDIGPIHKTTALTSTASDAAASAPQPTHSPSLHTTISLSCWGANLA